MEDPFEEAVAARERGEYALALSLFEKLARDGHPYALVLMARMYMDGHGTQVDLGKAQELLDQAARLGVREAVFQQAALWFDRGDMKRYFVALQEATHMGSLPAHFRLGLCYARGTGVRRDAEKAEAIIAEAARLGHVGAKMHLARRLLLRPIDLIGFVRGFVRMAAAIVESLRIGIHNPDDERLR